MSMNQWFQKGNARRFFRIDMPARIFITPASALKDTEIYANGSNYFPKALRKRLTEQKEQVWYWVDRIQDKQEAIKALFNEIVGHIEFFADAMEMMTQGLNPKKHAQYWLRMQKDIHGFEMLEGLKNEAPKTHAFLQQIENKFLVFFKSMFHTVSHSDSAHFEANPHLPESTALDTLLARFEDPKYQTVPLVQAIYHLGQFMNLHLETYRLLNDDQIRRHQPDQWPLKTVNISASGVAVALQQSYKVFEKVEVFLYFEAYQTRLRFDGSVVNTRSLPENGVERVAINFELPDGDDQDTLQNVIQEFEIDECMDLVLS